MTLALALKDVKLNDVATSLDEEKQRDGRRRWRQGGGRGKGRCTGVEAEAREAAWSGRG